MKYSTATITLFATIILLAAPFATLAPVGIVMGADVVDPSGIQTNTQVGQLYCVELLEYMGADYAGWGRDGANNPPSCAEVNLYNAPSWLTVTQGGGKVTVSGTPTETGSYTVTAMFIVHGSNAGSCQWAINVYQPEPIIINMLAGDTFNYQMETNVPSTFSVSSGDLATVGLTLSGDIISGTAKTGKQTVIIRATSNDGGPVRYAYQTIEFRVYNPLTLSGSIPPSSWAGKSYSTGISVSDVDPDATSEVTLALNAEATTAGYTLTKNSESSWILARSTAANVEGATSVTITATASAGGISQSKTMTATITTYVNVGIDSTPTNHEGTGTTVWLVEGNHDWTYTPVIVPEGAELTATGLVGGMTLSGGVLTVPCSAPIPETTVTLRASSDAGGSLQTATQTLTIKVWDRLVFVTEPSVSNIISTVDGRTVTASVVANSYSSIVWEMGDGVEYCGVTSVSHKNVADGTYTISVTVTDNLDHSVSSVTAVNVGETVDDPANPPNDDGSVDDPNIADDSNAIVEDGTFIERYGTAVLAIIGGILVVAYLARVRHPLIAIVGIAALLIAALAHLGII